MTDKPKEQLPWAEYNCDVVRGDGKFRLIPEAEARELHQLRQCAKEGGVAVANLVEFRCQNEILRSRLANFEEAAKTAWSVICKNCSGKSDDSTEHRAMEKLRQALEAK